MRRVFYELCHSVLRRFIFTWQISTCTLLKTSRLFSNRQHLNLTEVSNVRVMWVKLSELNNFSMCLHVITRYFSAVHRNMHLIWLIMLTENITDEFWLSPKSTSVCTWSKNNFFSLPLWYAGIFFLSLRNCIYHFWNLCAKWKNNI